MSTRAVIAWKTDTGFSGVYHHWDGYPTGLGKQLFYLLRFEFNNNTEAMLKALIDDAPGGWSTLVAAPKERSKYTDPDPQPICELNASAFGCEWAYVFNNGHMEIKASICGPGKWEGQKMVGAFGAGDPNATWKTIGIVSLDPKAQGAEPDWEGMEEAV